MCISSIKLLTGPGAAPPPPVETVDKAQLEAQIKEAFRDDMKVRA